jgi:hypothetical protein
MNLKKAISYFFLITGVLLLAKYFMDKEYDPYERYDDPVFAEAYYTASQKATTDCNAKYPEGYLTPRGTGTMIHLHQGFAKFNEQVAILFRNGKLIIDKSKIEFISPEEFAAILITESRNKEKENAQREHCHKERMKKSGFPTDKKPTVNGKPDIQLKVYFGD